MWHCPGNPAPRRWLPLWLPLLVLLLSGCETPLERMRSDTVATRIDAAMAPASQGDYGMRLAPYLGSIATIEAQGPTGRALRVEQRQPHIERFPCADCHGEPLLDLRKRSQASGTLTHSDVVQAHSPRSRLVCQDCHDEQARMNRLRLSDGENLPFDQSFRVCAQCHFQQAGDWEGGGHGKRLAAWAGQRIIRNCPACHNPHDPLHPVATPRWPAIVPNAPSGSSAAQH